MKSKARVTFLRNGNFTVPAGCNEIQVQAYFDSYQDTSATVSSSGFVLDQGGTVMCTGINSFGVLGQANVTQVSNPVAWSSANKFIQISSVGQVIYGLTDRLRIFACGLGTSGEIGNGAALSVSTPVAVAGTRTYSKVIGGTALGTDGRIYTWGGNGNGQLGVGDVLPRSSPTLVLGSFRYKDIALGDTCRFGLTVDGDLYAWGRNVDGQCGIGLAISGASSPTLVLGGIKWRKILGTGLTQIGLSESGQVYTWGANGTGQLGIGVAGGSRASPVLIAGPTIPARTYVDVFGSGDSFGAIDSNGSAYMWGANISGQLGVGDALAKSSPTLVLGGFQWSQVQHNGSNGNTLGITRSGVMYAWGNNSSGQLGVGDVTPRSSPVLVLGGITWSRISRFASSQSAVAVSTTNHVFAWGNNATGELGDGTLVSKSSPVLIMGGLSTITRQPPINISVPVVPGTTYAVSVGPMVSFGDSVIALSPADSVVLSFEQ